MGRGSRPDKIAAWAILLGIFLIVVAASSSKAATGGASIPVFAPKKVRPAPLAKQLGRVELSLGSKGDAVATLQRILNAKHFGSVRETGTFDQPTRRSVERFQRAQRLAVDGVVGAESRPALLGLMQVRTATWYGPGFYGRRTACGRKLKRNTLGVAHKTLRCGTKVTFYRRGRFVTVPVIDRGPYVRGVSWDLTEATARKLATLTTARVRSLH